MVERRDPGVLEGEPRSRDVGGNAPQPNKDITDTFVVPIYNPEKAHLTFSPLIYLILISLCFLFNILYQHLINYTTSLEYLHAITKYSSWSE